MPNGEDGMVFWNSQRGRSPSWLAGAPSVAGVRPPCPRQPLIVSVPVTLWEDLPVSLVVITSLPAIFRAFGL